MIHSDKGIQRSSSFDGASLDCENWPGFKNGLFSLVQGWNKEILSHYL